MKKDLMIKAIVSKWCRDAKDYEEWKKRYVIHDSIESKLNRNWSKAGIEMAYNYLLSGKSSEKIIRKFAYNELINIE